MSEGEWFEVAHFPHDIIMIREPHHNEDVKSYLIEGAHDVAIVDTGMGVGDFAGLAASLSSRRPRVLQTHAHWDHFGASHHFDDVLVHSSEAAFLREGRSPQKLAAAFSGDAVNLSRLPADFDPSAGLPGCHPTGWLEDGGQIDLGGRILEIIHTPGHSPGGVTFLDRQARALVVGDLLYLGPMYVFFPDSDPAAFRESLRRVVAVLDVVETVYPAHGPAPIEPGDIVAIQQAFEEVWLGRPPDAERSLLGYDVTAYEFGEFSFLLPPGGWRPNSPD